MELTANSPSCLFGAAGEKWPQLEQVIFIAHLLKMLLPRAPPQGSHAGMFIHSSSWYLTLQCEMESPGLVVNNRTYHHLLKG